MEVFNKQCTALAERWRSMTVGARFVVGLLAMVGILSIAFLADREAPQADMLLLGGETIAPDQLPRTEAAFAKAGLSDYQIEGGRIRIPRGRNSAYLSALAAADALPRNFGEILDDAVRQTNPLMSRAQQEEMIKIARQNELAALIQKMKGVERASVIYDRVKKDGLRGGENITACVSVMLHENQSLQREQVVSLRSLVSSSIAGLEPNKVTVIDLNSGRSFQDVSTGDATAAAIRTDIAPKQEPFANQSASVPLRDTSRAAVTTIPAATDLAWDWARQHRNTLGFGSLGLVSLLLLRAIVRPRPTNATAESTPAASAALDSASPSRAAFVTSLSAAEQNKAASTPATSELALADKTPESPVQTAAKSTTYPRSTALAEPLLRNELADLVRDDPHAAARVLRSWIGSPN